MNCFGLYYLDDLAAAAGLSGEIRDYLNGFFYKPSDLQSLCSMSSRPGIVIKALSDALGKTKCRGFIPLLADCSNSIPLSDCLYNGPEDLILRAGDLVKTLVKHATSDNVIGASFSVGCGPSCPSLGRESESIYDAIFGDARCSCCRSEIVIKQGHLQHGKMLVQSFGYDLYAKPIVAIIQNRRGIMVSILGKIDPEKTIVVDWSIVNVIGSIFKYSMTFSDYMRQLRDDSVLMRIQPISLKCESGPFVDINRAIRNCGGKKTFFDGLRNIEIGAMREERGRYLLPDAVLGKLDGAGKVIQTEEAMKITQAVYKVTFKNEFNLNEAAFYITNKTAATDD